MSLDPTELFVGQTGTLYVADVGTAFPATIDDPVGAGWSEVGFVTTDGVKFNFPKPINWIRGWQSRHPLRGIRGDFDDVIGFNLQQWNADTIVLSFGGGSVEDSGTGWRYLPPPEEEIAEVAFLAEGHDGTEIVRFGASRAVNQAANAFTWARSAESMLPVELMVLASADEHDWFMDFTSAAFAPSGS